jgi:hypothetical protein
MTMASMSPAAVDLDEFCGEKVEYKGNGNNPIRWTYRMRWLGYEEGDDTWLTYSSVKNLTALDEYAAAQMISIPE